MLENLKEIKEIEKILIDVLNIYSPDNIDIVKDELTETICIMYHSDNNSFLINDTGYDENQVQKSKLEELAILYNVGLEW